MRYVYQHFGSDWKVTILAADAQETAALQEDAKIVGAELIMAPASFFGFFWAVFRTLAQNRHDIIQSQGFISAITTCLANIVFRKPHVLTVHGVLEGRLLQGIKGSLKRLVTNWAICSVDVVYAVSEDILAHVQQRVSCLSRSKIKQIAIMNGIEPRLFVGLRDPGEFRLRYGLGSDLFLFGFLGRFMPQKGFDKIVEALAHLEKISTPCDYRLVAVGSGDCRSEYEALAKEKDVFHRIVFLPFQHEVSRVYGDLDAVVMPSVWEACPLQPMETLVSGVPLIVSDCIGLREVVCGTPAIVVPDGNPRGLAHAMANLLNDNQRDTFLKFSQEAAVKYDVKNTSSSLERLFESLLK